MAHGARSTHLLNVSEAITLAAIERKESRGGQFREDYPPKINEFGRINFAIKKRKGRAGADPNVPIPEIPTELKQIIEELGDTLFWT